MTWENESVNPDLCEDHGVCDPIKSFITELHAVPELDEAERLMGAKAKDALVLESIAGPRQAPRMCEHVEAATVLGFDPELWALSERSRALVGLEGVHIDLTGIRSPLNYGDGFGEDLQTAVQKRFDAAGLKILSVEEMDVTPGKPEMNVYFSHTNHATGCRFRLFAGLSQTMLLTRDHTIKLKSGTWGMVGGWVADDPSIDEFRSIMIVIEAFIKDWRDANQLGAAAQLEP